jgi:uncharacterized membrane protein
MKKSLGIILGIAIVLFNINFLFVDMTFFENEFDKLDNYNSKQMNETTILSIYFQDNSEFINSSVYTSNEVSHLKDVKDLISFSRILMLFLVLIFLLEFEKKSLLYAFPTILIISLVLFVLSLNFSLFFNNFHELFFTGNYSFPSSSFLIQSFPEQFFNDAFLTILFRSLVFSFLLWIFSWKYFKQGKNY